MARLRREVGFWGSLGRLQFSDLVAPELGGGLVIGIASSIALVRLLTSERRESIVGDYLLLTPALLGVVFAALALVVALMSSDYLRLLRAASGGVLAFLSPFMLVIGLQVGTILLSVGYRAFAGVLTARVEHWLFCVVTTLFAISCLEVVALARSVLMHGLARSRLDDVSSIENARDRKSGRA